MLGPAQICLTFRESAFGPRLTPEHVKMTVGRLSKMRPARDSAEKPAKTTECTAPMRAHASCSTQGSPLDYGSGRLHLLECVPEWVHSYPGKRIQSDVITTRPLVPIKTTTAGRRFIDKLKVNE